MKKKNNFMKTARKRAKKYVTKNPEEILINTDNKKKHDYPKKLDKIFE